MGAGCCNNGNEPEAPKPAVQPDCGTSSCQDECHGSVGSEENACGESSEANTGGCCSTSRQGKSVDDCCSPPQEEKGGCCSSSDKKVQNRNGCGNQDDTNDPCCGPKPPATNCGSEAVGKRCPEGEGECCYGGNECEDSETVFTSDQETLCCDGDKDKESCDGQFGLLVRVAYTDEAAEKCIIAAAAIECEKSCDESSAHDGTRPQ